MPDEDSSEEFVVDECAIWGTWIENDEQYFQDGTRVLRIYINDAQTLTFERQAAKVLLKVLITCLEEEESRNT